MRKEDFEIYISQNQNFTTADMGKYFNISSAGALYWLRKFGFSYKKNPSPMWKQTKRSEMPTKKSYKIYPQEALYISMKVGLR